MDIINIEKHLTSLVMQKSIFNDASITILDVRPTYYPHQNWYVDPHQHPWFEFYYFIEGDFFSQVEDRLIHNLENSYLLIKPGEVHSHFHGNTITSNQLVIRFTVNKNSAIGTNGPLPIYEKLYSKLCTTPTVCNAKLENLFLTGKSLFQDQMALWNYLLNLYDLTPDNTKNHIEKTSYSINLYLRKNYSFKITTADISKAIGYSYRNISRIYKKETGMTIIYALNTIRIEKAQKLLLNTSLSVSQIAQETGFENPLYFSNTFKKMTDHSPTEYRKKFAKEHSNE